MNIENGSCLYQVGEKAAEAEKYRLFLCKAEQTGQPCLLQVAVTAAQNGELDRNAYILGELKSYSDKLEEEYAKVKKDPKVLLNYHLGFPELVDSFISKDQGGRRINILAFRNVENISKLVPLINLTQRDRLRLDLRTSVWILGKLLKMLVFTQSGGYSVNAAGNNILIEPEPNRRYVIVFDWSDSVIYSGPVPMERRCEEISQAAQSVIIALGGDFETGVIPDDGEEAFARYTDHLLRLARGSESNAERAHAMFYDLADSLWTRGFYPFTTKPLED
jgi:hypothetical protein